MVYLADGTKVSSLGSDAAGLVYRGSFVYRRTAEGAQSVESVAHDEGRMLAVQGASETEFIDTWHVRDYIGSVRTLDNTGSAGGQVPQHQPVCVLQQQSG